MRLTVQVRVAENDGTLIGLFLRRGVEATFEGYLEDLNDAPRAESTLVAA